MTSVEIAGHPGSGASLTEASRTIAGRDVTGFVASAERSASKASAEGRFRPLETGGFTSFYPRSYGDPFVASGSGVRVAVRAVGGAAVSAEVAAGRVVYRGVYAGTDSIHRMGEGRVEEILLLRSAAAPARFEYEIESIEGASRAEPQPDGSILFARRDGRGIRIDPPWVVDAEGRPGTARWELGEESGGARALAMQVDVSGLRYPLAVDPSFSSTASMSTPRYAHTATLLPSGMVLVAGGMNSTGGFITLSSAELYDPATNAWSSAGSMSSPRSSHTATLLPSGKVLIAGGFGNNGDLSSAEQHDPATNSWSSAASLSANRELHTATLLPSGMVLVAGGFRFGNGVLSSAELLDVGLGYAEAWRPVISSIPSPLPRNDDIAVAGSLFTGISEASGGNGTQNSSSNYPLLQLRSLDSGQTRFVPQAADATWSETSFVSTHVGDFPPGFALATVFVNGIPSISRVVLVGDAITTTTTTTLEASAETVCPDEAVTLTATVEPAVSTGTVTFFDGANVLDTTTPSAGVASITSTSLAPGAHAISAAYSGDGDTFGSASEPVTVTVGAASAVVQFSATDFTVAEGATATITVTLTGGCGTPVTVHYATVANSATASDFISASGTLAFGPGQTTAEFTVRTKPDTAIEGDESFLVQLSSTSGGASLGQRSVAVVTIADDDTAGSFDFDAVSYPTSGTLAEGGSVTLTVLRTGGTGTASVRWTASNGTATGGAANDFTGPGGALSGTLTFAPSDTSKALTFTTQNDAIVEGSETFRVTLSGVTAGVVLGHSRQAIVTITDDEVADDATGTGFYLDSAVSSVGESDGSVTVTVRRNGASQARTVRIATSNGSASAPSDYTALASTTLSFPVGTVSVTRTIAVNADAGNADEGAESFNVNLSRPSAGATLGQRRNAVVVIEDDDSAGAVVLSASTFAADEQAGTATITLARTGGTSGAVTVNYTTAGVTAADGSDFTAVTNATVTFADGEGTATITVTILDDMAIEGNEVLNLTLSSPTGGATLDEMRRAVVTIVDDEGAAKR